MLPHGAASFKEYECVMEEKSWIPSHIIQFCNSRISWNVLNSLTWWIFSNTTSSWLIKKNIHPPLEAILLDSLIYESLSRTMLNHWSYDQAHKIKSRYHSSGMDSRLWERCIHFSKYNKGEGPDKYEHKSIHLINKVTSYIEKHLNGMECASSWWCGN